MRRRALATTVAIIGLVAAFLAGSVTAQPGRQVRPVDELSFTIADQGDSYFSVAAELGVDGGALWHLNRRAPLYDGSIIWISPDLPAADPPSTVPPDTTTTTTAPAPATTAPVTTIAATTTTVVEPAGFFEDFSDPDSLDDFDYWVHHKNSFNSRDREWIGDHDTDCGDPSTTRLLSPPVDASPDPQGLVYWCRNHLMTSVDTSGYALISFAPKQTFTDVNRVCWDQNATLQGRKWTTMMIINADRVAEEGRLDFVTPRLKTTITSGGIPLQGDDFMLELRDGKPLTHVGQSSDIRWNYPGFTNDDKTQRFQVCIEDQNDGTVRIFLETDTGTNETVRNGAFPAGDVRVIFGDDTYNGTKGTASVENPFTWHWDNIFVGS